MTPKVKAAIGELTPLLAGFIANPFDPRAISDWYIALATHCPLWALQEREYRQIGNGPATKLVLDHAWRVMLTASEAVENSFVHKQHSWNCLVIEPKRVGDQWMPTVQKPPRYANQESASQYLLHVYRSTLLRRLDETPLKQALRPAHFRMPESSKEAPGDHDPDDPGALPSEIAEAVDVVDTLRRLVVDRDLAAGKNARESAQDRLSQYLRDIGVTAGGGRPSLPNSEQLVAALAKECKIWLAVERACHGIAVSPDGLEKLGWWMCPGDPQMWAEHLAFPFLTRRELDFLRMPERPPDDRCTAICLIHYRLKAFLNWGTAADYAVGTRVKEQLDLPKHNPLHD